MLPQVISIYWKFFFHFEGCSPQVNLMAVKFTYLIQIMAISKGQSQSKSATSSQQKSSFLLYINFLYNIVCYISVSVPVSVCLSEAAGVSAASGRQSSRELHVYKGGPLENILQMLNVFAHWLRVRCARTTVSTRLRQGICERKSVHKPAIQLRVRS